jgi:hypothetical protein
MHVEKGPRTFECGVFLCIFLLLVSLFPVIIYDEFATRLCVRVDVQAQPQVLKFPRSGKFKLKLKSLPSEDPEAAKSESQVAGKLKQAEFKHLYFCTTNFFTFDFNNTVHIHHRPKKGNCLRR